MKIISKNSIIKTLNRLKFSIVTFIKFYFSLFLGANFFHRVYFVCAFISALSVQVVCGFHFLFHWSLWKRKHISSHIIPKVENHVEKFSSIISASSKEIFGCSCSWNKSESSLYWRKYLCCITFKKWRTYARKNKSKLAMKNKNTKPGDLECFKRASRRMKMKIQCWYEVYSPLSLSISTALHQQWVA